MADLSFDSLIEEYLVYCHIRQLRQKTMNSYEQTLRLFQRWCYNELGIMTVDAVSESVIQRPRRAGICVQQNKNLINNKSGGAMPPLLLLKLSVQEPNFNSHCQS